MRDIWLNFILVYVCVFFHRNFIYHLWLRYQYRKPSLPSRMAVTRCSCRICRLWSWATNRIFCRCCIRLCVVDLDSNRRCCVVAKMCPSMHLLGLAAKFVAQMDWHCVSSMCPYWDWLEGYCCWCRHGEAMEPSNSNCLARVEYLWFCSKCRAGERPNYFFCFAFHSMRSMRTLLATWCLLCY